MSSPPSPVPSSSPGLGSALRRVRRRALVWSWRARRATHLVGIAAGLAIAGAVGAASLASRTLHEQAKAAGWVAHTEAVLDELDAVRDGVLRVETGERGYLLTGDPVYHSAWAGDAAARAAFAAARRLTRDNAAQQHRLDSLAGVLRVRLAQLAQVNALAASGRHEEALAFVRSGEGRRTQERLEALVARLAAAEQALLRARMAAMQRHAEVARAEVLAALVAAGLAACLAWTLLRCEARRLRRAERQASGAAAQARAAARAHAASDAFSRSILEASPDCVKTLDLDGRLLSMNSPGMCLMEVDDFGSVRGSDWAAFWQAGGSEAEAREAIAAARAGARGHFQGFCPTARGTAKWWDVAVTPIRDADGAVLRLLSVSREITAMKAAETALRESEAARTAQATRDELTGLLNRRGFRELAEHEVRVARRGGRRDAVLYVDLDRFKPINDRFGHAAGDEALRVVARLLTATMREADVVARLGGDEFAVYLTDVRVPSEGREAVARLRQALARHNAAAAAAGRGWSIELSAGTAVLDPGDSLDAALARADAGLYDEKEARRLAA